MTTIPTPTAHECVRCGHAFTDKYMTEVYGQSGAEWVCHDCAKEYPMDHIPTPPFTATEYAARLKALVLADLAADPERYGGVTDWTGLHSVCDANSFLLDVEETFGYDWPSVDSPEWVPYHNLVNEAISLVVGEVFPLPTVPE